MKVLFVDDDKFFGFPYAEELTSQFPKDIVDVCNNIDDAVSYVKRENELRVIVLDIMMPTPKLYNKEVGIDLQDGHSTGVWFLSYCKVDIVERLIRVVVLTNRNLPDVEKMINTLDFPPGLVSCNRKADVSAENLPKLVRAMQNARV